MRQSTNRRTAFHLKIIPRKANQGLIRDRFGCDGTIGCTPPEKGAPGGAFLPATVLCRLFASMGYRLNFLRAAAKRPVAAATSADAAPRGVVSPVVGSLEEREGLVLLPELEPPLPVPAPPLLELPLPLSFPSPEAFPLPEPPLLLPPLPPLLSAPPDQPLPPSPLSPPLPWSGVTLPWSS